MEIEIYKNLSLENLPNEEWKDVVGYEGIYMVSNLGRVKSLPKSKGGSHNQYTSHEKIMKTNLNQGGYVCVNLHKDKKIKRCLVHRLLADSFLPKENSKNFIDHINGVRYDNRLENLRWCTVKENASFPLARENKSKFAQATFTTEEYRKRCSERLKEYYSNPQNIIKNANTMKRLWSDESYRERFLKNKYSEEAILRSRHTRLCKPVIQFDMDGNFIKEYYSATEAQRATNIHKITACCRGERNHAGGFIWKYKE